MWGLKEASVREKSECQVQLVDTEKGVLVVILDQNFWLSWLSTVWNLTCAPLMFVLFRSLWSIKWYISTKNSTIWLFHKATQSGGEYALFKLLLKITKNSHWHDKWPFNIHKGASYFHWLFYSLPASFILPNWPVRLLLIFKAFHQIPIQPFMTTSCNSQRLA